eukprot:14174340-Alexandrium_andersonii.AAC.1
MCIRDSHTRAALRPVDTGRPLLPSRMGCLALRRARECSRAGPPRGSDTTEGVAPWPGPPGPGSV